MTTIKLSVAGLAKYMTSSPANQRKVLRDYKYPDEDQPIAMRMYYKDAVDRIHALHASNADSTWLVGQAKQLEALARSATGSTGTRLRNNARALDAYANYFTKKKYQVLSPARLRKQFGDVLVTVSPDLHVVERKQEKVLKFHFSKDAPSKESVKIVSQLMYEAAADQLKNLKSSSVLFVDVGRGEEHKGARAGARTLREIEAACKNIAGLWSGI